MSFIKRVSVKGFLFLPPFPACPQFAFASEASSRAFLTLGTRGTSVGWASKWALCVGGNGGFSSQMPLEPLGLVTGDPISCSAVSKLDHLMPASQLLLFCLLQPDKEGRRFC